MILTSHQPNFLPYMGVFYKFYKSDVIVISDDVLYSKKGMHNWNYIRVKDGVQKITVPVNAHQNTKLCDVTIAEPIKSIPKVIRTLREGYSKTLHFNDGNILLNIIEEMVRDRVFLADFNVEIIRYILNRMGIEKTIIIADKDLHLYGNKDDRILSMCKKTGVDTYYSGIGAKSYHENYRYSEEGIKLIYSDYQPVLYKQKYEPFIPNMSVIDYIFSQGYKIPEEWL